MLWRAQDSHKEMGDLRALMLGPMVMAALSHGDWCGESHKGTELSWRQVAGQTQLELQPAPTGNAIKLRRRARCNHLS